MRPEVGSTSPMIMAMVVVLPAPLPPSNQVILPDAMRNETPSTARVALYTFTRSATSIAAGAAGAGDEGDVVPSRVIRPFLEALRALAQARCRECASSP